MPGNSAVLGKDLIFEIDHDISRTILPSWASPGATKFYSSDHGKLSADEWRTLGLIRFIVTLPHIWGPGTPRRQLMLDNFMHLTNAMVIASTREVWLHSDGMTLSTPSLYRQEYAKYLQGRVELYLTAKIQPTEHIAYHIGDQMENLGPMPSRSTSALERFNGMLQNTPTNMRSGEIETTFMKMFCIGANLKALIRD
ncbi:hypothetical protein M422DRAFT_160047, partial [Sphaerobolus stellatus SS14]